MSDDQARDLFPPTGRPIDNAKCDSKRTGSEEGRSCSSGMSRGRSIFAGPA